jgi:hypothetical protein
LEGNDHHHDFESGLDGPLGKFGFRLTNQPRFIDNVRLAIDN